jgi:hypothetical protein
MDRLQREAPDLAESIAEERISPELAQLCYTAWVGLPTRGVLSYCLAYTKLPHVDVRKRSFVPTADAVVTHSLKRRDCSQTRRTA